MIYKGKKAKFILDGAVIPPIKELEDFGEIPITTGKKHHLKDMKGTLTCKITIDPESIQFFEKLKYETILIMLISSFKHKMSYAEKFMCWWIQGILNKDKNLNQKQKDFLNEMHNKFYNKSENENG